MSDKEKPELPEGHFLDETHGDAFEDQDDVDNFEKQLKDEQKKVAKKLEK